MQVPVITFFFVIISFIRVPGQGFEHTDFTKADSVAERYSNYSLKDLKLLADKLTSPLSTPVEKFRAIYKWVCNTIEYDYTLFVLNKQKREKLKTEDELNQWNKYFSARVFKTLLNKQKTVCSGYAYLVKVLSTHAGLHCVIVEGYGRTAQANVQGQGDVNHSWNAVQLNAKWYLCDATWSAGAYDTEMQRYSKKFNEAYFLPDPALFIRNHFPLDSIWVLQHAKPTLQEFLNRPLIYSSLYTYKINPLFPETFTITTTKGKAVSFQFKSDSDEKIDDVALLIKESNTTETVALEPYSKASRYYCINKTFTRKGTHIVHILLNHQCTLTYAVVVR